MHALLHNKFVRSVAVVASGTAGAQAIAMLFVPIITRLYGPEAFGLLGVFLAITMVIIPLASLAYPTAIVLPEEDREALGLIRLSFLIAGAIALGTLPVLALAGDPIARLIGLDELPWAVWLLPVVILFAAFHQVSMQWLIRQKLFARKARAVLSHGFLANSIKAGFGLFWPFAAVLVTIAALGQGLLGFLMYLGGRESLRAARQDASNKPAVNLKKLASEYSDFPLFRAPQVTLFGLSQSLPVIILMSFYGPAAAGFFTIARQIISMPSSLISLSVGDVFYPRITEASRSGESLQRLLQRATLALAAVGVLPFGVVILFGPELFSFVLGDDWLKAGHYGRWLAVWMFFAFLNTPTLRSLPVLKAQKFHLVYTCFTITVQFAMLALAHWLFQDDLLAIAWLSVAGAGINIVLIAVVLVKARRFDANRPAPRGHADV